MEKFSQRMFAAADQSFRSSSLSMGSEEERKKVLTTEGADRPFSVEDHDILSTVQKEGWYKEPLTILVVGASGDLAKKKTYPSLLELRQAKLLPAQTTIRGFARSKKTHEELREHLRPGLLKFAASGVSQNGTSPEAAVDAFLEDCFYDSGKSYGDWEAILEILKQVADSNSQLHNLLVYLSIPPHVFAQCTQAVKKALSELNISGWVRVILEKPFGHDTESSEELLQTLVDQDWNEHDLYRIDHYLGKEMVQNILTFRQHNPWLGAIWNKQTVESVHLIFKEDFGTDGRGGYFDQYGIIRDILQNHLCQVLTLIAMDLPEDKITNESVRDAKVNVLRNMPPLTVEDSLVAQYDGYKDDPTIEDKDTICPTYACLRSWVNTDTWRGVPFILEAGKALDERVCEVRINFRGGGKGKNSNNALVLRLQPVPSIFFTANLKTPGYSKQPIATRIGIDYAAGEKPGAYTRLILDALRGEQASFVRDDELREAWKVFTPLLQQLEAEHRLPRSYASGTDGPLDRADFLLSKGVGMSTGLPSSAL